MSEPTLTPESVATRVPRSRRLWAPLIAGAVLMAGISSALYYYHAVAFPKGSQMPSYAVAASADTPLFLEMSLPKGALNDVSSIFTESRLLTEKGRAEMNELWPQIVDATLLDDAGIEALRAIRRVAIVPVDDMVTLDYMTAAVAIIEFDSAAACETFVEQTELMEDEFRALEFNGKPVLLVSIEASEAELAQVEANLRSPQERSLATSESFQEVLRVNRGYGLFGYLNTHQNWDEMRGQLRDEIRYIEPFSRMDDRMQRRFVRGIEELLAPEEMGATGFWIGLDEMEAIQRIGSSPLYDSGLFGATDDSLMSKLPAETGLFIKFALFEQKASEVLAELERRCPNLWRFAAEAMQDHPDHMQWTSLVERIGSFGDTLTGQFIFGLSVVNGEPKMVLAAGLDNAEDFIAAIEREAELNGEDSLVIEERDGYHVVAEDYETALFLDHDAVIWLIEPGMYHGWGPEDEFHWQADSQSSMVESALRVHLTMHNGLGDLPAGEHRLSDTLPGRDRKIYEEIGLSEWDFWEPIGPEQITLILEDGDHNTYYAIRVDATHPDLKGVYYLKERGEFGELHGLPEPEPVDLIGPYLERIAAGSLASLDEADRIYRGIDRGATFVFGVNVLRLMSPVEDEYQEEELAELRELIADQWISISSAIDGTLSRSRANVGLQDLAVLAIALRPMMYEWTDRSKWRDAMEIGENLRAALDEYYTSQGEQNDFPSEFTLDEIILGAEWDRSDTLLDVLGLDQDDLGNMTYFPPESIYVHIMEPIEEGGQVYFEIVIQGSYTFESPRGEFYINRDGESDIYHGYPMVEESWEDGDDWGESGDGDWDDWDDWDDWGEGDEDEE